MSVYQSVSLSVFATCLSACLDIQSPLHAYMQIVFANPIFAYNRIRSQVPHPAKFIRNSQRGIVSRKERPKISRTIVEKELPIIYSVVCEMSKNVKH